MVGCRLPKWILMLVTGAAPLATLTTCDLGPGGASLLFDSVGYGSLDVVVFDGPFAHDCCGLDEVIIIEETYVYEDEYWYEDDVYVEEIYIVEQEVIYEEIFYDDWFF